MPTCRRAARIDWACGSNRSRMDRYEGSNCRWANLAIPANNKRSNRRITIGDETRTLQQWSDHFGVDRTKAKYRLAQGWPLTDVFSKEGFRR